MRGSPASNGERLSGLEAADLRAAQEARRELTDQLLQHALEILEEAGVGASRD